MFDNTVGALFDFISETAVMKENGYSAAQLLAAANPGKISGLLKETIAPHSHLSVQQALSKWYNLLRDENYKLNTDNKLFSTQTEESLLKCLIGDINRIPALLMEEFVSSDFSADRLQYIRLLQALLVNLSNEIYAKMIESTPSDRLIRQQEKCCNSVTKVLDFLRNFFYQYFDLAHRMPVYCQTRLSEKIAEQLKHIPEQILYSVCNKDSGSLCFYQADYINILLRYFENPLPGFTKDQFRIILFENNFNAECFVEAETKALNNQCQIYSDIQERIQFLEQEKDRITHLKIKTGIAFDKKQPSLKKQLCDWVTNEIKQIESEQRKASLKESGIDPECKIQTTLSVAKLAVLFRLMVVDKIIINQPVAPALRTVAKVFTTLQKDEISFGSLETKYHAPDKTTLKTMKAMLEKWITIVNKL